MEEVQTVSQPLTYQREHNVDSLNDVSKGGPEFTHLLQNSLYQFRPRSYL